MAIGRPFRKLKLSNKFRFEPVAFLHLFPEHLKKGFGNKKWKQMDTG